MRIRDLINIVEAAQRANISESRKGWANIGTMARKVFWNPSHRELKEMVSKYNDLRGGAYFDTGTSRWEIAVWPARSLGHWHFVNELFTREGCAGMPYVSLRITDGMDYYHTVKDWKIIEPLQADGFVFAASQATGTTVEEFLSSREAKRTGLVERNRDLINVVEAAQRLTYPIAPRDEWHGNMNYANDGGRVVQMTPDEYLSKVRPLVIDEISRENIDDLKDHILSGRTLDPLVIYSDGKEDGRHRANAAKELGIREVPVIVFGQALAEQFVSGFEADRISKKLAIEVFKNPSRSEYKTCKQYDAVRAIIVDGDLYVWTFSALHAEVAAHMKFPNTCIPVVLYGDYKGDVSAIVTDYSARTVWHHDADVADSIRSALEDFGFKYVDVSYYDEDIVGDWSSMDEDEDEDEN